MVTEALEHMAGKGGRLGTSTHDNHTRYSPKLPGNGATVDSVRQATLKTGAGFESRNEWSIVTQLGGAQLRARLEQQN